MRVGLQGELEWLLEGRPLEPGAVARIGTAALESAPLPVLVEVLWKRLGLEGTRSRLVVLHGDGVAEDLTPERRT